MNLTVRYKKVIASVMAFSIIASGAIASEAGFTGNIFTPNSISASAAEVYGDWEYEITGEYTAKLVKYNGNDAEISIPQGFNGHSITELGRDLFKNNETVKIVRIPRGITYIPEYCFYGATSLKEVIMPLGVMEIKKFSFYNTPSLQSIAFPISVKNIGSDAFGMSGLTELTLRPDMVMGVYAFENCTNLKKVNFPDGLAKLYVGEFNGCTALESITLPETLTTIEANVFKSCSSLESVEIPASVTSVGSAAFECCTSLKSITLLNVGEDTYWGRTFGDCTSLENVNLPDESEFKNLVKANIFNDCINLRKVNNEDIINYLNVENSEYPLPKINPKYAKWINEEFADIDPSNIGFFEDMLRAKIKYIVSTTVNDDMTEGQKIKALHDWVCNKVKYAYDENGNPDVNGRSHVDSSVFMRNETVCEGYARGLTLLYNEAGIESYYVTGENHAWCMVRLGDRYFHIDATHDDDRVVGYDHFLISDSDIKKCSAGHRYWGIVKSPRAGYTIPEGGTPECAYSVGDANMDGVVDSNDADLVNAYLNGEAVLDDFTLADADLDGEITENDIVAINNHENIW